MLTVTFNLIHDDAFFGREKIIRDAYCELIRRALARADYALARAIGARALRECAVEMRALFADECARQRIQSAAIRAQRRTRVRREWHGAPQYVGALGTRLESVLDSIPHYCDYDAHDAI